MSGLLVHLESPAGDAEGNEVGFVFSGPSRGGGHPEGA
jgi:hypothetical protein